MLKLNRISAEENGGVYLLSVLVIMAVVAIDQFTKNVIATTMHQGQSIPVLANVFHITYVGNPGAAFGMLAYRTQFFLVITVVVLAAFVFFYRRLGNSRVLMRLSLALIVGGSLGNFVDRLRVGYVIDFLDFQVWPVFNVADMAICIGVALLCWEILRAPAKTNNETAG